MVLFGCVDKDRNYRNTNIYEIQQTCIRVHSLHVLLWTGFRSGLIHAAKLDYVVYVVASSLSIMFWAHLHDFCSIGGALCLNS